ncbi:MAG: AbrB/MazE/SpoVT family DNA-binding domain-containing protein [Candidatus Omnitrophica bacterium]|nr:hypothetical protein [bacterium]NUN98016.1 AbrB/MazE/SpoVT family DNA-binding domain-containing protein [Candidatus Omnitrophota bacterium]
MPVVKVGSRNEVVIPKTIRDRLGIETGDYVEVALRRDKAVITRKTDLDTFSITDEPIGPKMRAGIRQGLEDVAEGRVSGPFKTAAEIQRHLDSLKK